MVAGVDMGFEDAGALTRAAAVLLDAVAMRPLVEVVARLPTRLPYIPGSCSFRELPAVLAALAQLPELILVDGQGVAHPRGLGIAAHLGVVTGTIGVAKKILGGSHDANGPSRGERAPLVHSGRMIGTALRSAHGIHPLTVSPDHRMSHTTAVERVLACGRGDTLTEPTRLASRRDR